MDHLKISYFAVIALGAALGANARYLVSVLAAARYGLSFPYGTLIVNSSGSLILGFFLALTTERIAISTPTRLLFVIGFLGSYTTFSTFAYENLLFLQTGAHGRLLLNMAANNLVSLIGAFTGVQLARLVG